MEETIGLGFHSHRDAITGVASSTVAVPAASASVNQQHATTKFVSSSSADSKRMSMLFPPPPPHPSTVVQQPIQLNDNSHPSLQIQQQQLPLSALSTQQPHDMHQNIHFTNHPPTSSFQPPPGLPPPLSIPAAIAVPPLQLPPPPIPILQQSHIEQQQQQNDSIAKARAIAQRFHTQSNNQPPSYISSINNQHSNYIINNDNNNNTIVNNDNNNNTIVNNYAQKRQQHFQTEQLKLQTYTLKNLDYILKHDETQLRSHVECMNEMTEWGECQGLQLQLIRQQQRQQEEQNREQQQQRQQQREVQQKSGGGIGTKDQRYLERIKRRRQEQYSSTGGNTAALANPQRRQQRTSVYLTNLPTDGSITERTLHSLFCVYGHLDRVTMYRNRSTGELKGDGLIVFGVDDATIPVGGNESGDNVQEVTNGTDLIETVCMQMNGAELPCGTVIGVEPADMDWGRGKDKKKFKQMDHRAQQQQQGTASSGEADDVMQSKEASTKVDDDEEEEDLDDFFASLE